MYVKRIVKNLNIYINNLSYYSHINRQPLILDKKYYDNIHCINNIKIVI